MQRKSIITGSHRASVNAAARQGRDDPHLMKGHSAAKPTYVDVTLY
jgi:hypothetical protein